MTREWQIRSNADGGLHNPSLVIGTVSYDTVTERFSFDGIAVISAKWWTAFTPATLAQMGFDVDGNLIHEYHTDGVVVKIKAAA